METVWWFLLFVVVVLVIGFSKTERCHECGSRDPSVYSSGDTEALCDTCWLAREIDNIMEDNNA